MKLSSGKEIKDSVLSDLADEIARDMLQSELTYNDVSGTYTEELQQGYGNNSENLIVLTEEDSTYVIEYIRQGTLNYLQALRTARENIFSHMMAKKRW
jgi:hypothetical protein